MSEVRTDSVTIEFTSDEFEMLQEMASAYQDCGPHDEGWKSPEASALDGKIQAIWNERHKDVLAKHGEVSAMTAGSMGNVVAYFDNGFWTENKS
jgi:hypothetical protein